MRRVVRMQQELVCVCGRECDCVSFSRNIKHTDDKESKCSVLPRTGKLAEDRGDEGF